MNGNAMRFLKNSFWLVAIILTVSGAIALYAGLPKRVEANEIKNELQDEVNQEQDTALDKLVASLDGYAKAQEMRNEFEQELRQEDLKMRELLIEMIGKNTARIDDIKRPNND